MKKIILVLSLLLTVTISSAQYSVMGYYPNTQYGDYVIVYGYYQSNGIFTLSHCRTNSIGSHIYSNLYYLDINTCSFRPRQVPATSTPALPGPAPQAAPASTPAFVGSPA